MNVVMKNYFQYLLFLVIILRIGSSNYVSNHSFVFIGGWPQSGTSFIHQLLSQNEKLTSSMIPQCEKILGAKRCQSWNHEGQWVLEGKLRALFSSGNVCPVEDIEAQSAKKIVDQWKDYWVLEKPFLIEKSPQSFVKLKLLSNMFNEAKSVKFIIVLKHPITLNVATPRDMSWRYRKDASGNIDPRNPHYGLSLNQMVQNINFFHKMMTQPLIMNKNNTLECSMGWLPAMKYLSQYLQENPEFAQKNVRIVRFERLMRPVAVCNSIWKFLLDSEYPAQQAYLQQLCAKLLPASVSVASSSPGNSFHRPNNRNSRVTLAIDSNQSQDISYDNRRQLRLRTTKESQSFKFRPELVRENGMKRLAEFAHVMQQVHLPKQSMNQLRDIEIALSQFGYNLKEFTPFQSVFDQWEIK